MVTFFDLSRSLDLLRSSLNKGSRKSTLGFDGVEN